MAPPRVSNKWTLQQNGAQSRESRNSGQVRSAKVFFTAVVMGWVWEIVPSVYSAPPCIMRNGIKHNSVVLKGYAKCS